ncbi:AlpA family transcriptional regulator [Acidocella sp. KAb 2-4]|uniref:helix-turn-helix transcriptional regulator n=1 Tax=Acidocella sp. KAb 2-4 TaxID=2885158 RepID=UPI001D084845|nr:helix-turn-helix domain-containing protein [Acidocella sp. KAb 2-4]MCB5943940.1 helix-turn-helix domain-containing protein [Acidocella sp. KAb 2-4]
MADKTSQTSQTKHTAAAETTTAGPTELRPLLTANQAAERLGVPPSVLERWRGTGEGPAYIKLSGKYVRYRQEDLETFIEARRCQSTAQG